MTAPERMPKYEVAERGDTLAQQIYNQLAAAVLSGMFAPGERLNIRRLADEMGVSATPAREALLRLISEEVLQITSKGAIQVPVRQEGEIAEIFSIRRMLEGNMAAAAARNLDDEDLRFLEESQKRFLEALAARDFKTMLRHNAQFHFRIYERANQPVGLKIVESLWLRIGPTLHNMYPYLAVNRARQGHHENIIDAALHRDPDKLRSEILGDLAASEAALGRYFADYRNAEAILSGKAGSAK